jgi:hypothetical protein
MLGFKEKENSELSLVPSAEKIINQINYRWPKREKSGTQLIAKKDTREVVVSKKLNGSDDDEKWLANQLLAYCNGKKSGSVRIATIYNGDEVASATHTLYFWKSRNWKENIGNNIKIVFNSHGENDPMEYSIPILVNGQGGIWSGEKPFYDKIVNSINTNSPDRSVWNLACRLKELGFIEEPVLPEGRQKYPKNGIRNLQDYMGIDRTEYNEKLHRIIWGEFRISADTP